MSGHPDLNGIDQAVVLEAFAEHLLLGAAEFVICHHLAQALDANSPWFLDTATMASDLVRDLQRATNQETP